jgi:hypothetical protein
LEESLAVEQKIARADETKEADSSKPLFYKLIPNLLAIEGIPRKHWVGACLWGGLAFLFCLPSFLFAVSVFGF